MKNIKIGFLALLIITVFASCEDLFDGAILDVELPDHESELAPYAFFGDTDSVLTVMVGKSVGILDATNPDVVFGATVELYKNGVLEHTFTYADSVRGYQVALNGFFNPTAGDEYELRVSAEGFEMVSATQVMPEKVEIIEGTVDIAGGIDQFGDPADIIEIRFRDPAGVQNYYEAGGFMNIRMQSFFDTTIIEEYTNPFYFESNDPNFSDGEIANGTLSDLAFDGQEYLLRLQNYNWFGTDNPQTEISGVIFFNSVTAEYATYLNSLNDYYEAENNPFAEPVLLYSNMSGGLGTFGLYSSAMIEF